METPEELYELKLKFSDSTKGPLTKREIIELMQKYGDIRAEKHLIERANAIGRNIELKEKIEAMESLLYTLYCKADLHEYAKVVRKVINHKL
jgi:hypothetical protein